MVKQLRHQSLSKDTLEALGFAITECEIVVLSLH